MREYLVVYGYYSNKEQTLEDIIYSKVIVTGNRVIDAIDKFNRWFTENEADLADLYVFTIELSEDIRRIK